jgi:hypothetical protein
LESDVEHHEFDKSLGRHQATHSSTLPVAESARFGSDSAAKELAAERDHHDADRPGPGDARVEQTEVGFESRGGEVQRDENGENKIFDLLRDLGGESAW